MPHSFGNRSARRTLGGALGALAIVAATAPAGAGAASLPADTTAILSGTPDLLSAFATPAGNSAVGAEAVSRDGSRVAFDSDASGLSDENDDAVMNVYVKDVASGAVELVSRASGAHGEPAHANCFDGAISADGRQVAFECVGPLDPADTNDLTDVYVRNLDTQTTTLVSRAPGGAAGNSTTSQPSIGVSGGTTFVAFSSGATNLLGGAPLASQRGRVYRATLAGGAVTAIALVSGNGDPAAVTTASVQPSISDDGSRVAFQTNDALDAADGGSDPDVYVRDFNSGRTIFASRQDGAAGAGLTGSAVIPAISGDGTTVAFTAAERLDPAHDPQANSEDVYLRSLSANTTTLASAKPDGTAGDEASAVSIDESGRAVSFISEAGDLTADSTPDLPSAYVFRVGTGVRLMSPAGVPGSPADVIDAAISGDGTQVALRGLKVAPDLDAGEPAVVLRDVASGATRSVSRPPGSAPFVNAGGREAGGAVSADGRFAVFLSDAPAFGVSIGGVFVRDLATGAVTLASRADGVNGAPLDLGEGGVPAISADGRRVAFVAGGQVFVRDLAAGRTFEASVADGAGGAPGNDRSHDPSISDDGSRVAFTSSATNLAAGDGDSADDVYVRDLATGRTALADVVSGTGAKVAGGEAIEAAISGDGRSVAFVSADRLDPAFDIGAVESVFVHRLDSGATLLASLAGTATTGDSGSDSPSLDRDGNRVGFRSSATNFGGPLGDALYVRDLAAGTLTLASRADGPTGASPSDVVSGLLSADGEHVAFVAATNTAPSPLPSVAPGDLPDGVARVYERDLASGVTRLVSRRSGADGAALGTASLDPELGGITADGGCVSFETQAPLLPGQAFANSGNVYVRAVSSNCGRPDPNPPGTGGGPGPGAGTPPAGPAVLSKLALKPARFFVGGRKGGTKISFRLDRAASVTLAFDRLLPGRRARRKGARCSTRLRHGGVRCTVVKRFGRLTVAQSKLHAGANTVKFSGRIGRKALTPGRYRLTATPLHGKARTVGFVVVKAPKAHKRKARR